MRITGNALDYSYEASSNILDFLNQFSGYCAAAAEIDSKYCQLAFPSTRSSDSTGDIINRINSIINVLATTKSFYNSVGGMYAYFEVTMAIVSMWAPGG